MDVSSVVQIVGSLGFPVAACIYLFYTMQKDRELNMEQREADRKEHKEEMQKVTDALNNNTLVVQKLIDALNSPVDAGKH